MWKESEITQKVPDEAQIAATLMWTGFHHLDLHASEHAIRFNSPKQGTEAGLFQIDVGGIAKGLFAEWICEEISRAIPEKIRSRAEKLVVDVGGDIYCRNFDPEIKCIVGIRSPDGVNLWGTLEIGTGAVVTSGTYERFYTINGIRYCHIIDPRNGQPVETNLSSVTILDPSGALADSLATTVFVIGEEKAWDLIKSRTGTDMLVIREDGSWKASEGIEKRLQRN